MDFGNSIYIFFFNHIVETVKRDKSLCKGCEVKMNPYTLDDSNEIQVGGRKGKTCSMTGCSNTHQRFPNMSFFRFPKELSRFVMK